MKYIGVFMVFALLGLGCHKSAETESLSGVYTEVSPTAGGLTLNFVNTGTVIVSGTQAARDQLLLFDSIPGPDTLQYTKSADSISFVVVVESGRQYSLIWQYKTSGQGDLVLTWPPCPPAAICLAAGEYSFKK